MKDNCLFCKIIAGEIPAKKIYEDDTVIAFLDIAPTRPGHTLVVPKVHYQDLFTIENQQAYFTSLLQVANKLKVHLPLTGLNVVQNNGASAGQEVFHLHFHLIPAYSEQVDSQIIEGILID